MTDRKNPAHGQSATFFVNGSERGAGMLLLYPDELTTVVMGSAGTWVYVGAPVVYAAVELALFHTIGWAALRRRRAGRKASAGGAGVTVIPLEQVTRIQISKPRKAASWLGLRNMTVTTADGTEYAFRGLMDRWHTHLAQALAAHGREIHTEPENITVMPWATLEEG
jgi:hypothetical protein